MEKLLLQEETHWHQRAKRQRLKAGDLNTSFFHQCTRIRHSKNFIEKLVDDEGKTWTKDEDLEDCITNFYSNLFSSISPSWETIEKALRFVDTRVNQDMNSFLDSEFSYEEI